MLYQPLKKKIVQVVDHDTNSTFKPSLNKKTQELAERKTEGKNVY